ncbi:hypothetical protein ACVW0I_001913 [Bradyrhizobium sp. LM6.11]
MARLPLIDPETTSGDIRASFDRMPVKLNIFRMMAHAEANMIPAMRLGNSILHKQKLSAVNRELLILQAAQLEGGAYEWHQHVPIALGVGCTQAQIDAVERADYDAAGLSDAQRALLKLGREGGRERPRSRSHVRCRAKTLQRPGDRRIHRRPRLLHDDGASHRGDRDRSRSCRRHESLRRRQEAGRLR